MRSRFFPAIFRVLHLSECCRLSTLEPDTEGEQSELDEWVSRWDFPQQYVGLSVEQSLEHNRKSVVEKVLFRLRSQFNSTQFTHAYLSQFNKVKTAARKNKRTVVESALSLSAEETTVTSTAVA